LRKGRKRGGRGSAACLISGLTCDVFVLHSLVTLQKFGR
jgi:hypothetical protein